MQKKSVTSNNDCWAEKYIKYYLVFAVAIFTIFFPHTTQQERKRKNRKAFYIFQYLIACCFAILLTIISGAFYS